MGLMIMDGVGLRRGLVRLKLSSTTGGKNQRGNGSQKPGHAAVVATQRRQAH